MRYELHIEGLDCAACALKIEQAVSNLDGVNRAGLTFATGLMHIESERRDEALVSEVAETVQRLERGARVTPRNQAALSLWEAASPATAEDHSRRDGACPSGCTCALHHEDHGQGDHIHQTNENSRGPAHQHSHSHAGGKASLVLFGVGAAAFAAGWLPLPWWGNMLAFGLAAVLSGWPILLQALRGLRHGNLDENLLVVVAVAAAFAIGEWPEAALVTLLFRLGNFLEDLALSRSRRSIEALAEICPDTAKLVTDAGVKQVEASSLQPGDLMEVAPFDRIAADGIVESGRTNLDASALTGEALPVEAEPGDEVLSGMLNQQGLIRVRVSRTSEDSSAARILRLVEDASAQKGKGERFITRFARVYTPLILIAALVLCVVPTLLVGDFTVWLSRALVFLVASCPCALVISIPLAYFSAIGAASKKGVLIKGGRYVEQLAKCKTVAFDKTGTLTSGKLSVTHVACAGLEEDELLRLAGRLEAHSAHPIALAIAERAGSPAPMEGQYSEIPGHGVRYEGPEGTMLAGSARFLTESGIDTAPLGEASVYIAVNGRAVGAIAIGDSLRPDAADTVARLHALGVERVALLTGDGKEAAERVGAECEVDKIYYSLLPEDKVTCMNELRTQASPAVFVGDGINDAPVLACADVGMAMGFGTDSAIESADGVLSSGRLSRLPDVILLFRRAMRLIHFNTAFALTVKAVVLVLGALGMAPMWMAVFADVGVSMITVLNSSRLLMVRGEPKQGETADPA